jgi:peroxiredoxin
MRKINLSSAVYPACIVLLLLSNGFLLWQQSRTRGAAGGRGASDAAVHDLLTRPLRTTDGEVVYLSGVPARFLVLFVFTPGDCVACLEELTELNRVAGNQGHFSVYGLMSYASPDEMEQTRQNFKISFPLLQDPRGDFLQPLKLPKTPWKIVVNLDTDQIVYEDMPSFTPAEREAFISRLGLIGS